MQLNRCSTKRRRSRPALVITAAAAALAVGLTATPAQAEVIINPTLRDAAERTDRFLGTAIADHRLEDETYASLASSQFSSVTAENVMKWDAIEPSRGEFDFTAGDRLIEFAEKNDQLVYGHVLVWHSQLPSWVTEGEFTDDEFRTVMTDHVTEVASHYRGKVQRWDVVNEPLNEDGTLRETVFQQQLGESYIVDALRAAHAADPKAKLFINDYNIDGLGPKSDGMYELVKRLKRQGVPIHGIGFQGHLIMGQVPDDIQENMQRFANLGLEVVVTELDIRMELPVTEEKLAQQDQDYRTVTQACLAVSACRGITVWGFGDGDSWVPSVFDGEGAANIYDENYQRKPAYYAMLSSLLIAGQDHDERDKCDHGKHDKRGKHGKHDRHHKHDKCDHDRHGKHGKHDRHDKCDHGKHGKHHKHGKDHKHGKNHTYDKRR